MPQIPMSQQDKCDLIQSFRSTSSGRSKLYSSAGYPLTYRLRHAAEEAGMDPDEVASKFKVLPFRRFWQVVSDLAEARGVVFGDAYLAVLGTDFDMEADPPHPLLTGV